MNMERKKKLKRYMIILIISMMIAFFLFPLYTYAETIDDTFEGADDFVSKGGAYSVDTSKLSNTSRYVYNALLAVGMVLTVIVGLILGIKYMTSTSEDKAEVKETLVPYIVSCCVIFGAFTIWKIVVIILK